MSVEQTWDVQVDGSDGSSRQFMVASLEYALDDLDPEQCDVALGALGVGLAGRVGRERLRKLAEAVDIPMEILAPDGPVDLDALDAHGSLAGTTSPTTGATTLGYMAAVVNDQDAVSAADVVPGFYVHPNLARAACALHVAHPDLVRLQAASAARRGSMLLETLDVANMHGVESALTFSLRRQLLAGLGEPGRLDMWEWTVRRHVGEPGDVVEVYRCSWIGEGPMVAMSQWDGEGWTVLPGELGGVEYAVWMSLVPLEVREDLMAQRITIYREEDPENGTGFARFGETEFTTADLAVALSPPRGLEWMAGDTLRRLHLDAMAQTAVEREQR